MESKHGAVVYMCEHGKGYIIDSGNESLFYDIGDYVDCWNMVVFKPIKLNKILPLTVKTINNIGVAQHVSLF